MCSRAPSWSQLPLQGLQNTKGRPSPPQQSQTTVVALTFPNGRVLRFNINNDSTPVPSSDEPSESSGGEELPEYYPKDLTLVSLYTAHGKYVCANPDQAVICNKETCFELESFRIERTEDGKFTFQSHHGGFFNIDSESYIVNTSDKFLRENFWIENHNGKIALKTSQCKYVRADPDGKLRANNLFSNAWEQFTMSPAAGLVVVVRSRDNQSYLSVQSKTSVVSDHTEIGTHEKFVVVQARHGKFGLKTHLNTFLCVEPNGTLVADRILMDEWESFSLQIAEDRGFTLRTAHGTTLSAKNIGGTVGSEGVPSSVENTSAFEVIVLWNDSENCVPSYSRNLAFVTLYSCHGRYMSAERSTRVHCYKSKCQASEMFKVEHINQRNVFLQSLRSEFLYPEPNGASVTYREQFSSGNSFQVENWCGKVAFKSQFGKYLCAEVDGRVVVNRDRVGRFELFTMSLVPGYIVALRARKSGNFLSVESPLKVVADRKEAGQQEQFTVVEARNGRFGLRTHLGTYLCCEPHGPILANRNILDIWETFSLEFSDDGFAICTFHDTYLFAESNGEACAKRTDANGKREAFDIVVSFHQAESL